MGRPSLTGLAGACLAVAAVFATLLVPAPAAEALRPRSAEPEHAACTDPATCPELRRDHWARWIAGALEVRLPALAEEEREHLALTIADESDRAGIDPLLVLALIEVESRFDPAAASFRGARGLMQLRPSTMKREAERSGITFEDPHEPIANVQAGVRYFKRLLDAFGREEVALMAYNAGPNRILRYLREGEIPERFHAYPRRVKQEHRRLRRSLGAEPGPLLAERDPVAAPDRGTP